MLLTWTCFAIAAQRGGRNARHGSTEEAASSDGSEAGESKTASEPTATKIGSDDGEAASAVGDETMATRTKKHKKKHKKRVTLCRPFSSCGST